MTRGSRQYVLDTQLFINAFRDPVVNEELQQFHRALSPLEHFQADTWPHRVCQPIARYWYAEMLRARGALGDGRRARDLLSEALSGFELLGMPFYARQAHEKLTFSAS